MRDLGVYGGSRSSIFVSSVYEAAQIRNRASGLLFRLSALGCVLRSWNGVYFHTLAAKYAYGRSVWSAQGPRCVHALGRVQWHVSHGKMHLSYLISLMDEPWDGITGTLSGPPSVCFI